MSEEPRRKNKERIPVLALCSSILASALGRLEGAQNMRLEKEMLGGPRTALCHQGTRPTHPSAAFPASF